MLRLGVLDLTYGGYAFSWHQRVLLSFLHSLHSFHMFKPLEGARLNKMVQIERHCSYLKKQQQIVPDDFPISRLISSSPDSVQTQLSDRSSAVFLW